MKKMKRWIAIVLVVLMSLPLCGCQMLDEMRASHATFQEDGSILWDGNVYRVLDLPDEMADLNLFWDRTTVYVTKADVPVLLSRIFGQDFDTYNNGIVLQYYSWDSYEPLWYCREDQYEAMAMALSKEFILDAYYYEYYTETNVEQFYLSDEQFDLIGKILTEEMPLPVGDDFYITMDDNDYTVDLNGCDAQRLKYQEYIVQIVVKNEGYYLVTAEYAYSVPSIYNAEFGKIVKVYYENCVKPYIG